jgi:multimeric flavodoxin WrbA
MKLLLHDVTTAHRGDLLAEKDFAVGLPVTVITPPSGLQNCIECFACWIVTPGLCAQNDGLPQMAKLLGECNELILVSRCFYGCYSPGIQNLLERSIPYMVPFFIRKHGETRHPMRYDNHFALRVCFYGEDISEAERTSAKALVRATAKNLQSSASRVSFYASPAEAGNSLKEDLT